MRFLDHLKQWLGRRRTNGGAHMPSAIISCEEALSVVYEYLDGELSGLSHERVKAHFDVCARCYPTLRLEEAFRAAVRRAARGEKAPPELRQQVLDLLVTSGEE